MEDDPMLGGETVPGQEMDAPAAEEQKMIPRDTPDTPQSRKALVESWCEKVKADKVHWRKDFQRMRDDQDFCAGLQWSDDEMDDRYVANIVLRHVQQRVAALYAKNPKAVARRKPRLMNTVWDGTSASVMTALQMTSQPLDMQVLQENMAILQDAQQSVEQGQMLDKLSKTLEYLYEHQLEEQAHDFKTMMKLVIRRAITTSVGYVKLGFQRVMQPRPEVEARIADLTEQMATMKRLAADQADGVVDDPDSPEIEQLRLMVQRLSEQKEMLVREGIVIDYPASTSIIPDRATVQLREFLGANHVTHEYVLTPDEIKEIYEVDIGQSYKSYKLDAKGDVSAEAGEDFAFNEFGQEALGGNDLKAQTYALVWEIWSRKDGMVYVVCDGYPEFLRDPAPPDVWTERFWPFFPLVLNEVDHPRRIYPPSDVHLLKHQQREYNRLRQGLREHRIANRPKTITTASALSEEDRVKLQEHPANAIIELQGLQPGQDVKTILQAFSGPGVDPNLYEVNGVFEDVLRTVGVQEASLGGAAGGTATESSIAESSRMSAMQSNIDDLDQTLTLLARAAGQILLAEVGEETVKQLVGPGAVWPEMSRQELAMDLYLEIEAGSTGRPNQVQEIQNFERLAPLLMQIPGISPELMAREGIRRLDDRLRLEDLFDPNIPSLQAMNQIAAQPPDAGAAGAAGPGQAPGQGPMEQGAEGANNAPQADRPAGAPGGPELPGPNGTTAQPVVM